MNRVFRSTSERSRDKGFTLLEVAIGLILVGLLMIPAMYQYQEYRRSIEKMANTGNLLTIQTALQKYVYRYGRYPRPANFQLGPGSAGVGTEMAAVSITTCPGTAAAATLTACKVTSPTGGVVLIGAVPYAALGIPQEYAIDAYGDKFTYAVTNTLTDALTFLDNGGRIRITNESGTNTTGVSDNAHYVLIGHGRDRAGAFTLTGILSTPCSTTTTMDKVNCSLTGAFNDNFGQYNVDTGGLKYVRAERSATGVQHYDDYLAYETSIATDIWSRKVSSTQPLSDIYNTQLNNVRVGPGGLPTARLDIGGTAASPGHLKADNLWIGRFCVYGGCDAAVANSLVAPAYGPKEFKPEIIGGTGTAASNDANANKAGGGINCGLNTPLTGIALSDERCGYGTVLPAGVISTGTSCATGYAAHKVINGVLQCVVIQ